MKRRVVEHVESMKEGEEITVDELFNIIRDKYGPTTIDPIRKGICLCKLRGDLVVVRKKPQFPNSRIYVFIYKKVSSRTFKIDILNE